MYGRGKARSNDIPTTLGGYIDNVCEYGLYALWNALTVRISGPSSHLYIVDHNTITLHQ